MSEILSIGELLDIGGGGGGVDPSALSAYVPFSALGHSGASVTGISGSAISDTSKLDATASSLFYSTSNPSGFLTSSYTPAFGYNSDNQISSIDGSALAGGGGGGGGTGYTTPSGTMRIDNGAGTLDTWNSSLRIDSQVTPSGSTVVETPMATMGSDIYYNLYSASSVVWTGHAASGDRIIVDVTTTRTSVSDYFTHFSAYVHMTPVGGQPVLLDTIDISSENIPYGQTSQVSACGAILTGDISSIYVVLTGDQWFGNKVENTVSTMHKYPSHTSYTTACYENVLKDSAWASLTAWATSNGWTP